MQESRHLVVREMELREVVLRIDYFHDSSDEHLVKLGVDRASLPSREAWRSDYVRDYALPIAERQMVSLVWELDGRPVGFSSTDRVEFGAQAFMHLHLLRPEDRDHGLGAEFVKESARRYVRMLQLKRLYSEPNAFNTAPNRTLQRAGFRYVLTHEAKPSPINPLQITTRWVIDAETVG